MLSLPMCFPLRYMSKPFAATVGVCLPAGTTQIVQSAHVARKSWFPPSDRRGPTLDLPRTSELQDRVLLNAISRDLSAEASCSVRRIGMQDSPIVH
jgi:hypothetical protein